MNEPDGPLNLPARVRTLQVITIALLMGVSIYLGVALASKGKPPQELGSILFTYVGLAFAVLALPGQWLLPAWITSSNLAELAKRPAVEPATIPDLCGLYQTQMLVGHALLEGASFILLTAYLVENQSAALAATLVLMIVLAFRFPTHGRVERWLENQASRLDQLRSER